jgi:hypothetical protein
VPYAPKPACTRCRKVRCVCEPKEEKKESGWHRSTPTSERRPEYATGREQARRRKVRDAWLRINGTPTQDGKLAAICPQCGRWRTSFVADHEQIVALEGGEGGPLRVHCRRCSDKQASEVGHAMRRRSRA